MKEKVNHTATESPAVTREMLQGVGKKLRHAYLAGGVSADRVMQTYRKNVKEADGFSLFGLNVFELMRLEQTTHNPVLRQRLQDSIAQCKEKSRHSHRQNIISVQKLDRFRREALGIGLHKVVALMKRLVRKSQKTEDKIVLALLETEFANLTAKKRSHLKDVIYERKQRLLVKLAHWLKQTDWTYGINYNTGKNASYIIYVYLPGGVQLSWHCNEYHMVYHYPEINCEWDGAVCMTMEKILDYIRSHYHIGCDAPADLSVA